MRKIIICLLTLLAFTSTAAFAGAGHSHAPAKEITKEQALVKAANIVKDIAQKGKIDKSWAEIAPASGEKKASKYGEEWVVAFHNPTVKETTKQSLYVFLTLTGDYKAANYSGS